MLQPPSPEHSDAEHDELEDEEADVEQQTAYQKLLSTLHQPGINDSEEESTDDEDEEELLDEGELIFFLAHWGWDRPTHISQLSIAVLLLVGDSDGVGNDSEHGDEDEGEGGEESADEADVEAVDGEEKGAGDEFVDKDHETQFCLETNFTEAEEQGDADSAAEEDLKGTAQFSPLQLFNH